MNWRISHILFLLLLIGSCRNRQEKNVPKTTIEVKEAYYKHTHLIEAETLLPITESTGLKLIDFRKREDYLENHIPNAINIWRKDIEDASFPYKGMMATKEEIEQLFSRLGIQNADTLVVYDDRGSCDATRLWWVLSNYNFESVKILNGGLDAWIAAGGMVTDSIDTIEPSNFTLPAESSMRFLIEREELQNALASEETLLILDTRTNEEYTGKRQKSGAIRAGRIPNSKLIDWSEAVDYHGTKKFRSYEELEALYGQLGASKEVPIITYCHTGVRSAHTTFVLSQLLGYKVVKNYDGSWTEWSYYKELPFEKDSITVILQ